VSAHDTPTAFAASNNGPSSKGSIGLGNTVQKKCAGSSKY
jgi:hypothetical protein